MTNQIVYEDSWHGPSLQQPKTIVVNSFTKSWFIPGISVGWVVTKNREFVKGLKDSLLVQSTGINLFGQKLLTKVLQEVNYDSFLQKRIRVLNKRRIFMRSLLEKHGFDFFNSVEGNTNFYVEFKTDTEKLLRDALDKGIAFIPGAYFEGQSSTRARLGFGAVDIQDIETGIEVLLEISNGH